MGWAPSCTVSLGSQRAVSLFCSRSWQTRTHGPNPALLGLNLPTSFVYILSTADFLLQWQSWVVATDWMVHKAENSFYLTLYKESLLTPVLQEFTVDSEMSLSHIYRSIRFPHTRAWSACMLLHLPTESSFPSSSGQLLLILQTQLRCHLLHSTFTWQKSSPPLRLVYTSPSSLITPTQANSNSSVFFKNSNFFKRLEFYSL